MGSLAADCLTLSCNTNLVPACESGCDHRCLVWDSAPLWATQARSRQGKSWANRCSTRVRLVLSLDLAASLLSEGESKERPSPAIRPTGGVVASCKPPDSKTCPSTQVRTHFALFPIDSRLARGCHAFLSLSRWLGLLKRCRAKAAAPAFDPAELGLN